MQRQQIYKKAEKIATLNLKNIADDIFNIGYKYIINDLTGSICEIIDFENQNEH
jgi:hypothetical protein